MADHKIIPPPLNRMKRQHEYHPVGHCIYCPGDGVPGRLTEEHIIAESLGGMLILPAASCTACQDITGAFEGHNAGKLFRPVRRQYKMPSKQRGKARRLAREQEMFAIKVDGRKLYVPAKEYPGLLISFSFGLPDILLGIPANPREFSGGIALGTLPEFGERLNALRAKYGNNVTFPTSGSAETMGRLLAKTAHAYATAEIGYGKFQPYLLGIIRNQDPLLMPHLIGGGGAGELRDDLHEIGILSPDVFVSGKLIVVRIHLFSNHQGMPIHYVVAGERL